MDLVVTHPSADFDAFASAMAARKLYGGATVMMTQGLARGAREFSALHHDRFPWVPPRDVDFEAVRRLVIVDVRRTSRLRDMPRLLERATRGEVEVHVWDHHPASPEDVRADVVHVEPVGSATTLLVEEIRRAGLAVDAAEATLFALGVHADTGSLQFASSSPRDAEALAWLMARGASQRVLGRFLTVPFTEAQRAVLASAMERVEVHRCGGLRVAMIELTLDAPCEGLDEVTSELFRLESPHVLVLVARLPSRGRAHVIARSREGTVDVAAMLAEHGGGGHASAAAASRPWGGEPLTGVLLASIAARVPRPLRVGDVMSSPVRSVEPEHRLASLEDELARWGHTGVPVARGGELLGIVARSDLERAMREGRGELPVASCMSHPVRTIDVDSSLEEALEVMTSERIGRLPVMRGGAVVGIVTRSDVRDVLYGSAGES